MQLLLYHYSHCGDDHLKMLLLDAVVASSSSIAEIHPIHNLLDEQDSPLQRPILWWIYQLFQWKERPFLHAVPFSVISVELEEGWDDSALEE